MRNQTNDINEQLIRFENGGGLSDDNSSPSAPAQKNREVHVVEVVNIKDSKNNVPVDIDLKVSHKVSHKDKTVSINNIKSDSDQVNINIFNFKRSTEYKHSSSNAVCFKISNNFQRSSWGVSKASKPDIEVFHDMQPNVARIFIWHNSNITDSSACESGCFAKCGSTFFPDFGGHMSMALKSYDRMEYVSLYQLDSKIDGGGQNTCMDCLLCATQASYVVSYASRNYVNDDKSGDYVKETKANIRYRGECDFGKDHADYVIDMQFEDPDMKEMLDCWDKYNKSFDQRRYRVCGDACCLDNVYRGISDYQNCTTLCQNILSKGNYIKLLPVCYVFDTKTWCTSNTAKNLCYFALSSIGVFSVVWLATYVVDNFLLKDDLTTRAEAKIAGFATAVRAGIVLLSNFGFFCLSLGCSSYLNWLSPISFKRTLINAATSPSKSNKIKIVHTKETIRHFHVIDIEPKDPIASQATALGHAGGGGSS